MSSENGAPRDAPPETVRSLAKGLAALAREFEPIQKGIQETAVLLQPLTETLASLATVAAPFAQAAARGMERWDTAECLLKRGWVPNHTTPFDLVVECGDDDTRLQTSLLAYYTDNWPEVRARLESRVSSLDIDDEAKATFREALDAHEGGLYRCVSRLLFPEFERVFRGALFEGRAGQIQYHEFVTKLTGDAANLELADFLTAGIQDMVLFKYLTEGVRNSHASGNHSGCAAPKYEPGARRRRRRHESRASQAESDSHPPCGSARSGPLFIATKQSERDFHRGLRLLGLCPARYATSQNSTQVTVSPMQSRIVPDMSVPITMYLHVSKFISLHKPGRTFATFCQFDRHWGRLCPRPITISQISSSIVPASSSL